MPSWNQRLTKSLHQTRNQPESRYFQLATIDGEGIPENRTVVFRQLDDADYSLVIVSDTRSGKWASLTHQPMASVCWYFSKTREQYRFTVAGSCFTRNDDPTLISKHWSKLSDAGRKQYFWGRPSSVRQDDAPLRVNEDMSQPPEHFCVMKFKIQAVDYLSLQGNPQYREKHWQDKAGNWITQPVIP